MGGRKRCTVKKIVGRYAWNNRIENFDRHIIEVTAAHGK
jgi:hypothetical protein